jgi:SAM-dependent methyltransferase
LLIESRATLLARGRIFEYLADVEPKVNPIPFAESYRDASTHQMMLEDVVRTTSYDDALKEVIGEGTHVLDFGTGTGVLAIFSKRHGAARVDAVDRSSFIHLARRIAADSGHPDIVFHHANHEELSLDRKVDVLVSEWMGHCLFYEAMMTPLLAVRDRFLKEDGIMLPARVTLHAALLIDESFHEERAFFMGNPYGIDFSAIADQPLRQVRLVRVEPGQLDPNYFDLGTIDMKTVKEQPRNLVAKTKVRQAAMAYGVIAWFSCDLTDSVGFGTGPHDAPTHWDQLFLPFVEPFVVVPDRELTLEIRPPYQPEDEDPAWYWSLSDGEETIFVDEEETFNETAPDPV